MEARKKYFENAAVSVASAATDVESDEMYAFEQSAWGETTFYATSDGTADYDVQVSYDKGTTWYTAFPAVTNPATVFAPRVKVVARGDGTNVTTVHAVQREYAPTEATRHFEFVETSDASSAAATTAAISANTPDIFTAVVTSTDVTNWLTATATLETSFDGENWVTASSVADLDEAAVYQEIEITPTILGNYFRLSFAEGTTCDGDVLAGLFVREDT